MKVNPKPKEKMEENSTKRGGSRVGAGRKSAFGDGIETAQYMLPRECAQACQAYARVMLANKGRQPMQCVSDYAELPITIRRGDSAILQSILQRWHACGIETVEMDIQRVDLDHEYVILRYVDVIDVAEVIREYGFECGTRAMKC